jgi:hypothetical protein
MPIRHTFFVDCASAVSGTMRRLTLIWTNARRLTWLVGLKVVGRAESVPSLPLRPPGGWWSDGAAASNAGGQQEVYSITWSARASTDCGIVSPSAFAVFRLITSSNFVGCSTG